MRRFPAFLPLVAVSLLACAGGEPATEAPEAGEQPVQADSAASAASEAPASEGPDIWVAELSTAEDGSPVVGELRNVTDRPGYDNQPHFLPDGDLLFTRQDGERTDIWRWRAATGEVEPVTRTDPESEYSPTALPGGDGFSAVRVEADSTQRLWRFDMDGNGAEVLLADIAPVGYHAWVGADTLALFVLGDPATLQVASLGTGRAETRASSIGRSLQPVPDRRAFSYVQNVEGGTEIRVLDLDTGESEAIGPGLDGGDFHAWTPEGVLLQASGGRLARWHPSMGHWMPVASFTDQGLTLSRLAVSPDGRFIAIVAEQAGGGG